MTKDELEYRLGYKFEETESGCWLFTGGSKNGFHGSLHYHGDPWQAHRLTWALAKGTIPTGLFVLHECDVGMCVNPTHLFLGIQVDNICDMDVKGRSNRPQPGIKNGRALIKESDVLEIRRLRTEGFTYKQIASKYNLSIGGVAKIINRTNWSHI